MNRYVEDICLFGFRMPNETSALLRAWAMSIAGGVQQESEE